MVLPLRTGGLSGLFAFGARMQGGPSLHLSWAALACRDGTPYPHDWRDNRALILTTTFEDPRGR